MPASQGGIPVPVHNFFFCLSKYVITHLWAIPQKLNLKAANKL